MVLDTISEIESNAAGSLYSHNAAYVWVPRGVDVPHEIVRQEHNIGSQTDIDGVVSFHDNTGGRTRPTEQRARLWAELARRYHNSVEYRTDDERGLVTDVLIPSKVAADGPVSISAWLAVHDHATEKIADLLDVGDRTVSQYISDFLKGER